VDRLEGFTRGPCSKLEMAKGAGRPCEGHCLGGGALTVLLLSGDSWVARFVCPSTRTPAEHRRRGTSTPTQMFLTFITFQ